MNHLSLSQQHNLIQLLTQYNSKYEQINNSNQQQEEIIKQFIKIYSSRFQQKEFQYTLISSQIQIISQEILQQEQLLQTQIVSLDQIKEQREQLLLKLDQRELELSRIEKVLDSGNKRELVQHQFEDLQDGILMCKEKGMLLQEENLEFTKMASSLRQQNDQLKNRYSQVKGLIQLFMGFFIFSQEMFNIIRNLNLHIKLLKFNVLDLQASLTYDIDEQK